MTLIFEAILPVFLLVIFGFSLRKWGPFPQEFWKQFNLLGFYVLFPFLIFYSIVTADFSSISFGNLSFASLMVFSLLPIIVLCLKPVFNFYKTPSGAFTSIFQVTTRWHGFMALAIAEKIHGQFGLTFVAFMMILVIIPINLINIFVLVWFDENKNSLNSFIKKIISNPVVISALAGISINFLGIKIYEPILLSIDFIARAALGMGLLMIGAGVRLRDMTHPDGKIIFAIFAKLIFLPIAAYFIGSAFGLNKTELLLFVMSCGVPAAANGYVLAQKMGGDAPLYASILSFQIIISFITLSAILWFLA